MKTIIAASLVFAVTVSQAALFPLGISPAGTSAAAGLSPTNEVPPLTGTGSGGAISNAAIGAIFDSTTSTLQLSVGFGSSQGFGDLTGAPTTAGIFGPATTNENAAVLYDLATLTVLATNTATGGVIVGDVIYSTNDVAGLLSGLNYLNIATAANPNGEIRGQLIPLDIPPVLECPADITVTCGTSVTLTAGINDTVGNSVTVVWSLNGLPVQTNLVPAFAPPTATNVTFTGVLPTGTNTVAINAENAAGSEAFCSTIVAEVDTNPPVIVSASPSKTSLWPPNHKMIKITVTADVTDNCSATTWKIIGVQSNEATDDKGSGHTSPDWQILSDNSLNLRAERSGNGSGRIYTILIQAVDAFGNLSDTNSVTVTVPHDQGKGKSGAVTPVKPGKSNGNGKVTTVVVKPSKATGKK